MTRIPNEQSQQPIDSTIDDPEEDRTDQDQQGTYLLLLEQVPYLSRTRVIPFLKRIVKNSGYEFEKIDENGSAVRVSPTSVVPVGALGALASRRVWPQGKGFDRACLGWAVIESIHKNHFVGIHQDVTQRSQRHQLGKTYRLGLGRLHRFDTRIFQSAISRV